MSNGPHNLLVSIFHDVSGGRAFVRELAAASRRWERGCMLHVRSPVEGIAAIAGQVRWDGMVIQIVSAEDRRVVETADCPVVLFDPRREVLPEMDRVELDHEAVGLMAARHLLETGRQHFAMLGFDKAKISERREAAFVAAIRGAGLKCHALRVPVAFAHPRTRVGDESLPEIRRFVRVLPSPSAVFCGNDELARVLLEAALEEGIRVPADLAILGADDDDLFCLTCTPTLSSVRVPYHIAGEKAAMLLERRMRGRAKIKGQVVIPPVEVVMRDSTRVVPGEDRAVEEVMRRMHQGFAGVLRMEELARGVGMSLSALERRFKAALGLTPLQELRRLRLHEAKRLLAETSLPVTKVADLSGFRSATRFCIAFREDAGESPGSYRRSRKGGGSTS